jgi:hypothetical protein
MILISFSLPSDGEHGDHSNAAPGRLDLGSRRSFVARIGPKVGVVAGGRAAAAVLTSIRGSGPATIHRHLGSRVLGGVGECFPTTLGGLQHGRRPV